MFLHYVFDMWMKRNFPNAPFERYADDGVVHCKTKEEALYIKECLLEDLQNVNLNYIRPKLELCIVKIRTEQRMKT